MKVLISELLTKSQFGDIVLGSSSTTLSGLLGKPDDISQSKPPRIWKYGNVQLTVYESAVIAFRIFNAERLASGHKAISIELPKEHFFRLDEILEWLLIQNLVVELNAALTYDNVIVWRITGQKVSLRFENDVLESIGACIW